MNDEDCKVDNICWLYTAFVLRIMLLLLWLFVQNVYNFYLARFLSSAIKRNLTSVSNIRVALTHFILAPFVDMVSVNIESKYLSPTLGNVGVYGIPLIIEEEILMRRLSESQFYEHHKIPLFFEAWRMSTEQPDW